MGTKLLLIGSQARGDASMGSDWDMPVIVDKAKLTSAEEGACTYSFYELGWRLGEEINPILYTIPQWQQRSKNTFFIKTLCRKGLFYGNVSNRRKNGFRTNSPSRNQTYLPAITYLC